MASARVLVAVVLVLVLATGEAARAHRHDHRESRRAHARALRAEAAAAAPAPSSESAATAPAASVAPIRPATRCTAKLPPGMQRTVPGNHTARPQNMSPEQVLAFVAAANPTFVDPRFSTHHCIDGRHEAGGVHTPGGDISEFLLALAGYQESALGGAALSEEHVYEMMVAFIDAYAVPGERPFYMHTDHHADAYMRTAAGVDAAYSFAKAPAGDRDRLLSFASDPATVGCGHLKRTLQHPDVYHTPAALTANVLRAFWRALWRDSDAGTGAVTLHTFHEDANEGAMVVVTGAACGDSVMTFNPKVAGMGQVLVYQPEAPRHLRQTLARFLCDRRPALAADAACSVAAVRSAMDKIFAAGLTSTVRAVAADMPQDALAASAEAQFAGVQTGEPAPPESAAAAADAAYLSAGGNLGCSVTDATAQTLVAAGSPSNGWRVLSQQHAAALVAAGPAFVPAEGFTFSCIDGRSQKAVLGTPGGSFSEFLLALGAHVAAGLVVADEDTVQALLDAYAAQYAIPFYRQVYMHSDAAAVKALAAKLGAASLDLAAPPAALRARVLAHVTDPAYVGCEHLRLTLQEPGVYGVNGTVARWAVRAFFRALWADVARGAGRFAFEVLEGDRVEGAVVMLSSGGCSGRAAAIAPMRPPITAGSAPALGAGSALVYHYQDVQPLRDWNAGFFTEWFNPRLASPTAGATRAGLAEVMAKLFTPQLAATARAISGGLPQYWAFVSSSNDAPLLTALTADAAASAAAGAGTKAGVELAMPAYDCGGLSLAAFEAVKDGLSSMLSISRSRVLLSKLRCTIYTKAFTGRRILAAATGGTTTTTTPTIAPAGTAAGATGRAVPTVGVELLPPAAGSGEKSVAEALAAMKSAAASTPNGLLSIPGGYAADFVYPSTTSSSSSGTATIELAAWMIPSTFAGITLSTIVSLWWVKRQQRKKEKEKALEAEQQKAGGAYPGIPIVIPGGGESRHGSTFREAAPGMGLRPVTPGPGGAGYKSVDVDLDSERDAYGPGNGPARAYTPRGPGTPRGVQFRGTPDYV
eukprot:tig00020516_g9965.t1